MNFVSDHMRVRWIWLLRKFLPWVAPVEKVPPLGSNASCDDPSSMASSGESTTDGWSLLRTFWSENMNSRHRVVRPVQRCASDSSGYQGFPWCCSA